jgi:hypothetical protein
MLCLVPLVGEPTSSFSGRETRPARIRFLRRGTRRKKRNKTGAGRGYNFCPGNNSIGRDLTFLAPGGGENLNTRSVGAG